jgi:uroporphyrinogen decarboxylase
MLGVENLSYIQIDDEGLYYEIIDTVGTLCYENAKAMLQTGIKPDFGHYWEDICFKNGPLVNPLVFEERVAPHYRKISDLLLQYGIDIISLDCDGCIDKLLPIWLKNGVTTMFPIEVGTWNATIIPWREKYGRSLKGVGGMDKRVFSQDYAAIDKEIERLKYCVDLGGFIPCPDHRLPPESKWENVQYYCDRMHHIFG